MFPDLGNYAIPVLSAYASMVVLIAGLILLSLRNAKKSKQTLAQLEKDRKSK